VAVDDHVDQIAPLGRDLPEAQPHAGGALGPVVLRAHPDHLALTADQLESVVEPELEADEGSDRLGPVGADEDAARRDVGGELADEAAEALELELDARFERHAPGVAGNGRVDHRRPHLTARRRSPARGDAKATVVSICGDTSNDSSPARGWIQGPRNFFFFSPSPFRPKTPRTARASNPGRPLPTQRR